ncbi:hypothetical protein FACS1894216_19560 [Synergistales bacterium]|nr:hypothetical protein FACS1894216_19560 [Synergistales bacterium]
MIYLDCSVIYRDHKVHTGVQRVTRSIAREAAKLRGGVRWAAIEPDGNNIRTLPYVPQPADADRVPMGDVIDFRPGDVYFVLDSTWDRKILERLQPFKQMGMTTGVMCHDMFPVTHSELTNMRRDIFVSWAREALKYSDFFACNSQATLRTLKEQSGAIYPYRKLDDSALFSFPLGADLPMPQTGYVPKNPMLKKAFEGGRTYIAVSTMEPRKNHAFLLDAFDILWKKHPKLKLCVIGGKGWKVDSLIKRIENHPGKDKNLFWLRGLDDMEVQWAYSNARCTLYPSLAEGFGLPIIESLHYGTPVLASDIPVFHETAGDKIGYFGLGEPEALAEWIERIEEDGVPDELRPEGFTWPTWRESAEILLREISLRASENLSSQGRAVSMAGIFSLPGSDKEKRDILLASAQLMASYPAAGRLNASRRNGSIASRLSSMAGIEPSWEIKSHRAVLGYLAVAVKKLLRRMLTPFVKSGWEKQSDFNSNSARLFKSLISEIASLRSEVNDLRNELSEREEQKHDA